MIEGRAGLKLSEDDRLDSLMALACLLGPESTKSLQKRWFWQRFLRILGHPGSLPIAPGVELRCCAAG